MLRSFRYRTSRPSSKPLPRTHLIAPLRPKKKQEIEIYFEEDILYQLKENNKLPPSESNDEDFSFGRIIAINSKRL